MRSSAYLTYDSSNNALYAWVAFIEYETGVKQIDMLLFPTLGHAQAFYNHMLDGTWTQDQPGSKWYAYLKQRDNPYNRTGQARAVRVQLEQLLYMGDDQCSSESSVKLGEKQ